MLLVFSVLLLFSCKSKDSKTNNLKIEIAKTPVGFTCNYEKQKEACRKILNSSNSTTKEKAVIPIICDSLIPCWYGTTWDFYGTSEIPGKGSIACGYFVTTVIRDAGISINRVKMAQCPSEEMIKNLCEKTTLKRFSNKTLNEFVTSIRSMGYGLYITGLDYHTGFIYNDGNEVYFIHASYATPKCVVKEIASSSSVLNSSKYRVIGKLRI
jgi:hypothetical protein